MNGEGSNKSCVLVKKRKRNQESLVIKPITKPVGDSCLRISKQLVPSGGWRYKQGEYLLAGETFDLLVAEITSHRVSNGIAVGNVVEDIENQLAKNNPSIKLGVKLK